jgi:hypothetical protein
MANRTIKTPSGATITLSSEELSQVDLALAEVLLEMAVEQGSTTIEASSDEIIRRLAAKGYRPGGDPIH